MSSILVLSGSPSLNSRTAALSHHIAGRLRGAGHDVGTVRVRDLPAPALLAADAHDPAVAVTVSDLLAADGVVVASSVYKGVLQRCAQDPVGSAAAVRVGGQGGYSRY